MISKFFFPALLLTCIYTFTLKSIIDNSDKNIEKLTNNFNFQLNETKTVKPNVISEEMKILKSDLANDIYQSRRAPFHEYYYCYFFIRLYEKDSFL